MNALSRRLTASRLPAWAAYLLEQMAQANEADRQAEQALEALTRRLRAS